MSRIVLVTGGAGQLGSSICKQLDSVKNITIIMSDINI